MNRKSIGSQQQASLADELFLLTDCYIEYLLVSSVGHSMLIDAMKAFFNKFDLFGKKGGSQENSSQKKDTKSKCREWNRAIGREVRKIDRDVAGMSRNEKVTIAEVKKLAAKGEVGSVKILAKELIYLRKSRDRLLLSKTQLNSISNQLTQQAAMAKLTNAFQSSAQIMASMNEIVNVPEIHEVMMQMGKEMENMGLVEKIVADGIDEALGSTLEMEEQTEMEIGKLFDELAIENITLVPSAGKDKLPHGLAASSSKAKAGVRQNA